MPPSHSEFWHWLGPVLLVGLALLGTGGWIAYLLRKHDREIDEIQEVLTRKMNGAAHDSKYDPILEGMRVRITKVETAMPKNLHERIRNVEEGKLSIEAHGRICAGAMRSVETDLAAIRTEITAVNQRLSKGDDLFIQLSELAGRMKQHIEYRDKNPFTCPALDNAKKGGP